ncbi:UDP-4-amino-4,6-dideoxy-N-acetyl-beta-L-altrosamine transaminase [Evansella caseinilytica]|uniref:UDP-4-amino-4,6-dideoxy-N-acetyl-beta-L-altrosamine transaminase n=1 Tax=Evansella caseinilytica TaxID=1503961 RepID=A0A1H3S7P6_9BACI|nr:UDP-4-amino-4,6-dideoxy-N-acetyl-beta-L-altrosamine transaminase [Evansella caseinilytica]SDZ33615.1 UDP-4-amino-4,6-dideoxy-N-acetyl-beta-L-altrosamine transaminase [Evansella caseinilytica]
MLAVNGGKPVRGSFLSYGQQWIDEKDIESVVNTLKSPLLTQGPMVHAFEQRVADYVGTKYAVAFSNGTAALHAAYFAAGLTAGDEMITSPITFVATSNAALYLQAKPIFADIDAATYNLDPNKAELLITDKTKLLVPVDFTGQPADMDAFRRLADKYNLTLISDGAHSLGASYNGQPVGRQADMTMFSFHPVKPVTTGEGGVIVTDNEEYYEKLQLFRSHGIVKSSADIDGPWYYEMVELGMNYRLPDIQAALGYSQMEKLDLFIQRRREIAAKYTAAFSDVDGVLLPEQLNSAASGWHIYVLRFPVEKFTVGRKQIFTALRAENIGVHVHYIPVYIQPYYERLGYRRGLCPLAEKWYEEAMTLPIFPKMTDQDAEDVIRAVKKVVAAYLK